MQQQQPPKTISPNLALQSQCNDNAYGLIDQAIKHEECGQKQEAVNLYKQALGYLKQGTELRFSPQETYVLFKTWKGGGHYFKSNRY